MVNVKVSKYLLLQNVCMHVAMRLCLTGLVLEKHIPTFASQNFNQCIVPNFSATK